MQKTLRLFMVALLVAALVPAEAEAQNRKKKNKKNKKKDNEVVQVDVVGAFQRGAFEEAAAGAEERVSAGQGDPEQLYLGGLAYRQLQRSGDAMRTFVALADARPDTEAWHWIGASARALESGDMDGAVAASARAVELNAGNKYAHYQRGLVLAHQNAYQPAAEAFTRMLEIDGGFAYGHYHAGLAFYQVRSLVAATNHFERFLALAPEAPERVQVEGILAVLRGS